MSMTRIAKENHVFYYDENNEPILTVKPGTEFEIETWDCYMGQASSEEVLNHHINYDFINPATGPIAVEGAEPGDSLSVTLLDIRPNARGAAMCNPEWGQLGRFVKEATRLFDVHNDVVTMTNNPAITFPATPMFGVIGVSPESGSIHTLQAGRHGGNLDNNNNRIGSTIHLPVFQSGAQLAIGDMHASMGDGEICGTGVEIGGIGRIKVELVKGKSGKWPITETADSVITHGTSVGDIDEAMQNACEEAMRLLVDQWGFSSEDAYIFLSVAGDLGIAQYCHPCPGTVISKLRIPKISAVPTAFRS
jgi:amidase